MARQHDKSCDCVKSELDLFSIPPTQTSLVNGWWTDTYPVSSLTDGGPIEFYIEGDGSLYYDLSNTQLYVEASIQKANGTNLEDDLCTVLLVIGDNPFHCTPS